MALKKFNAALTQTLNGIDTYQFDHVCASASSATRFAEGATLYLKVNDVITFAGKVQTNTISKNGFVKSVLVESPLNQIRDISLEEEDARTHTTVKNLIQSVLPEGFQLQFNSSKNPVYKYAFRSGGILTHVNTLCAMAGLNWRGDLLTATTSTIVISEDGEAPVDAIEVVENVDIFNLKIDASLFKKYTHVTAVGVEKEVSGYTCTASLPATIPYVIIDYDDGELLDEEVLPVGNDLYRLTTAGRYNRISVQDAGVLKGWDGANNTVLINDEFIKFDSKSGAVLLGITRSEWNYAAITTHASGDSLLITQDLYVRLPYALVSTGATSVEISPATTIFRIGNEFVRFESPMQYITDTAALRLATVNATTGLYEGRGQVYDASLDEYVYESGAGYAHKQGMVMHPYYQWMTIPPTQSLAVTIHGKGIVTKDGIDRLAWGTLLNIQNGIISGSCTYKAGDFYDKSVAVGQRMTVTTASTRTGTATSGLVSPATTYDVIIYSIKRQQNKPMTIEFGNVIPEVLNMLKSGEYAMQAAIRKQGRTDTEDVETISMSGKIASTTKGRSVRITW